MRLDIYIAYFETKLITVVVKEMPKISQNISYELSLPLYLTFTVAKRLLQRDDEWMNKIVFIFVVTRPCQRGEE